MFTVTVKTDEYPNSTTWKLKNYVSGNTIISGGPYSDDNTVYTATACILNTATLQFEINDAGGNGICCSYGNGYYNITSGSTTYALGGNFGSQDIKIFNVTPQLKDLSVKQITINDYILAGNQQIQGKILNLGTSTVYSFNLHYKVNGGTTYTQTGITATIPPGGEYNFTHSTPWLADFGSNTVEVWASNIDGYTDMNTLNDVKSKNIYASIELGTRTVLVEHFTQASCGPCAAYNPGMMSVLNNSVNVGKYAHISYHTSWPGYDPMYNQNPGDSDTRTIFYGVGGVPTVIMEGTKRGSPSMVTTTLLNQYKAIPTICNIRATETQTGSTVTINATVTALADFPSGTYKLFMAVIEQMVSYSSPPGSNGEDDFPNVMRDLLPGSGIALPVLTEGETFTATQTYTIPSYVNAAQLRTVFFVQETTSKTVIQTGKTPFATGNNTNYVTESESLLQAAITPSCGNNGSISLSVTNGAGTLVNYQWSNGSTTPVNNNLAPGIYTVTLYSASQGNLLRTEEFEVPAISTFTVTPSVNNPSCSSSVNGSIGLSVSGSSGGIYSYQWSNGQTVATITNLAPGTYSVTVSNSNYPGCNYINSFTLAPAYTPTVLPPSNQVVCNGSTTNAIVFSGSLPSTTFSWVNNNTSIGLGGSGSGNIAAFNAVNNNTTQVTANITVTPLAYGCTGLPQTFSITVKPTPTVTPVTNLTLCSGQPSGNINFSGSVSGTTFTWTNNNTSIGLSASGTGNISSFIPLTTSSIPVNASIIVLPSASGCTGSSSTFGIQVNPTPQPNPTANPIEICTGQSSQLTASNGNSYMWSTGQTNASIMVMPVITTNYTVSATNAYGCQGTAAVQVTVSPLIIPNFNTIGPFCEGAPAYSLPAVSNNGIPGFWLPPAINTGAAGTQTYTFTPSGSAACAVPVSVNVTVLPNSIPLFSLPATYCLGDIPVVLPEVSLNGVSGTWNPSMVNTGFAGTLLYTFSPNAGGCSSSTTTTITVAELPVAFAGADQTICYGSEAVLVASGGTSYNWSGGLGNTASVLVNPSVSQTYTVTVTDINGCTNSDAVIVEVVPASFSILGADTDQPLIICSESGGYSLAFSITGGLPPFWINGVMMETANFYISEILYDLNYSLNISDNSGCTYLLQGTASPCEVSCATGATLLPVYDSGECIEGFQVITGAVSSQQFSIDGYHYQSSNTFTNLNAGTYPVFIATNCGIWSVGSFEMPASTLEVTAYVNELSNGTYSGITVVTGGTPFYTYEWSNGNTGNTAYLGNFSNPVTVTVTDKNGCQQYFILHPELLIGVTEVSENRNSFQIFPNPVSNRLHVNVAYDLPVSAFELQIFDTSGKLAFKTAIPYYSSQSDYSVHLPVEIPQGIYITRIQAGTNLFTKKITITR